MRANGNIKSNQLWASKIPSWFPRVFEGDSKLKEREKVKKKKREEKTHSNQIPSSQNQSLIHRILREQWIRAKYERKEFQGNSKERKFCISHFFQLRNSIEQFLP